MKVRTLLWKMMFRILKLVVTIVANKLFIIFRWKCLQI